MPIHEHLFTTAPFAQCHAATAIHLGADDFLVAWFGGSRESHDDVAIWGATRRHGSWSPPRRLAKVREQAHWNPVLFRAPDGRVRLYFKIGVNPKLWTTWVTESGDEGETWSEPRELVPGDVGGRGPVKNRPIVLSDGAWLAPASHERSIGGVAVWDVFVDRSEDGGVTWMASDYLPMNRANFDGDGAIQPALWESSPGRVHLVCRTSCGWVCRGDSADGGRTWSALRPLLVPNNNSGLDLAQLPDGRLALAHNPIAINWGPRTPLSLAVSGDNGETWQRADDLETGEGEYSYPSLIPVGDERVACVYTWRRTRIAFWLGRPTTRD